MPQLTPAELERSREQECNICFENITARGSRFGLMCTPAAVR